MSFSKFASISHDINQQKPQKFGQNEEVVVLLGDAFFLRFVLGRPMSGAAEEKAKEDSKDVCRNYGRDEQCGVVVGRKEHGTENEPG